MDNILQQFGRVEDIETYMATDIKTVEDQIELSLQRPLTEIEQLPEWQKAKKNLPVAIVGGGPSIKYTVEELRRFKVIIACGSVHDWLVEHGITPNYTIVLDPDRASANYLKHPVVNCNYLIASCCHPDVFDVLKDYAVTRWHSAGSSPDWYMQKWAENGLEGVKKPIIGGGCTCGLRAISIAMLFGYTNLHFFGLDSNLDLNDDAHHAYEFVDPINEHLGDVVEFNLSDPDTGYVGRTFRVAKYMMAQLWGFKDLITHMGENVKITVHGDSVIYDFMRIKRAAVARKQAAKHG